MEVLLLMEKVEMKTISSIYWFIDWCYLISIH
jgi:hypothetical protein